MLLSIVLTVLVIGAVVWLAVMASRYLAPRIPSLLAGVREIRQRIARNPADYVRAWVVRTQPARTRLEHAADAARARVVGAEQRVARVLTSFAEGKEPTHRFAFFVVAMLIIWVISVIAAAIIDIPIITALNAGNTALGFLGTLMLLCIPAAGSLLLGELIFSWRKKLSFSIFTLGVAGIVTLIAIAVGMLTSLAYVRAEVEYAAPLAQAEQGLAAARINGSPGLIGFAEDTLAILKAEEQRSMEWNTAQVPLAAAAEFISGLFVPLAVPVLQLADAKRARRKAESDVEMAVRAQQRLNLRQQARLSRLFWRLGLRQLDLRDQLAAAAPTPQDPPQNTQDEAEQPPNAPSGPTSPAPVDDVPAVETNVRFNAA